MCGVFGIRSSERDVARLSYFGLFALQHRGQEAAGLAVSDRGRLTVLRDMGLVAQVFDEEKLQALPGDVAIGHTRYSTTGSNAWANAQPLVHHGRARTVALGHNGNLTNTNALRDALAEAVLAAGIGAELDLPDDALTLFGEGGGRAILASSEKLPFPRIGSVGGSTLFGVPNDHLWRAWEEGVTT